MDVRPPTRGMVHRYASAWRDIELSFLDASADAVSNADALVMQLLFDRGYRLGQGGPPPSHVDGAAYAYTVAQRLARLNARGQATMEDRREAMARYRRLLMELLQLKSLTELRAS
jgi:hypothetical protein